MVIHMVGGLSNFVFHLGSDSRSKLSRTWRETGTVSNKKGRDRRRSWILEAVFPPQMDR